MAEPYKYPHRASLAALNPRDHAVRTANMWRGLGRLSGVDAVHAQVVTSLRRAPAQPASV